MGFSVGDLAKRLEIVRSLVGVLAPDGNSPMIGCGGTSGIRLGWFACSGLSGIGGCIDVACSGGNCVTGDDTAAGEIGPVLGCISPGKFGVVGVAGSEGLPNRVEDRAGDFFDGTVLLLCTELPVALLAKGTPVDGVTGLGAPFEPREFFDDTETLRRTPPYLRRLSAPPLAFEADLPMFDFVVDGGVAPL